MSIIANATVSFKTISLLFTEFFIDMKTRIDDEFKFFASLQLFHKTKVNCGDSSLQVFYISTFKKKGLIGFPRAQLGSRDIY